MCANNMAVTRNAVAEALLVTRAVGLKMMVPDHQKHDSRERVFSWHTRVGLKVVVTFLQFWNIFITWGKDISST
jgi:hypothetical protein